MKTAFLTILIMLSLLLSACTNSSNVQQIQTELEEKVQEMFNPYYGTSGQQAEELFHELIQIIESQDHAAMKSLFADSVVASVGTLDSDIMALFDAYQGEIVSFELLGPVTSGSKRGDKYTEIIDAIFNVTTTKGAFKLAFRVYTIDSHTPDNLGIHSVYWVKAEDSEMRIADWTPGINVESSLIQK